MLSRHTFALKQRRQTRFHASTALKLRSSLFWVVVQCRYIVSVSSSRILTPKDRLICCPEMSVTGQCTPCNSKILALFNVTIHQKRVNRTSSSVLRMSLSRHNKMRSLMICTPHPIFFPVPKSKC